MYSAHISQLKTFILLLLYIYLISSFMVFGQEKCTHSSTTYNITINCTSNANATNYTSDIVMEGGFHFTDEAVEPPYSRNKPVVFVYNGTPGTKYRIHVYEHFNPNISLIYNKTAIVVPNKAVNLTVVDRGATFLNLYWEILGNTSRESHEIHYGKEGSTKQMTMTSSNTFYNLTDLSPGSVYSIYIVALTLNVKSDSSETFNHSTAPLPPVNLTAVPLTTSSINITWSKPDSPVKRYDIKYSTLDNSSEHSEKGISSPYTLSPAVLSGQPINIMVYSVVNEVNSAAANIQSSTKPAIVSSLDGSSKVAGLTLKWNAPEYSDQIRYIIYVRRLTDNNYTVYTENATRKFFTKELDDLYGGNIYEVKIQAESTFAKGDNYTSNLFTVPEPVSDLNGFAVNTTALNITWNLPSKSEITTILVTVSSVSNGVKNQLEITDHPKTFKVIPNLIAGNLYNVSVQVSSKYTRVSSHEEFQQFTTKPVKAKINSIIAEEMAITIKLIRQSDEGDFDIFVAFLQNLSSQNKNTTDQVVFQGLTSGTKYTFVAYTMRGKEKSEQISVDVFTKPKPPRSLSVSADKTSILVKWDHPEPSNLDNFTVTLYKLGADAAQIRQLSVKDNFVNFLNLESGVNYNITVVAVKGDQNSREEFKEETTMPLPVSRIRVSARGVNSTTVTWDPPLGSSLTGYALTFNFLNLTLLNLTKETLQYRLDGLQAGANYSLLLYTYTQRPVPDNVRLYSSGTTFNFTTYPDSVAALQKVQATTGSISVNWTAPTSVNIDFYQLGILVEEATSRPNEPPQLIPKNITNATFSNLEPGFTYTIAIRTVKNSGQAPQFGLAVRLRTVTKPLPVVNLEVSTLNTTALEVKWSLNKTSKQNWIQVSYGDKLLRLAALNQSEFNIVLSTLLPGTSYNISVMAIRANESDEERSRETTARGFTVPMAVHNLSVTSDHSRILVSWLPPALGSISSYNIYYKPVLRDTFVGMSSHSTNTTNIRLSDLFPGEKYIVNVTAVSNGLESSHVQGEAATDPVPPRYLLHDKLKTTSTSATVYWSYSPEDSYSERWTIQAQDGNFLVVREVEKVDGQTDYELLLDQLMPGHTYNVSIRSHVLDKESVEIYINFTTKPVINSVLKEESSTNNSFRISYTVTMFDLFDHFVFNISGATSSQPIVKSKTEEPLVEFTNLQAGTRYSVQAITVINSEMSSPTSIDIFTVPNPVPVQLSSTSKTVSLSLGPQVGGAAQYTIVCTSVNNVNCGEKIIPAEVTTQPVVFTDLLPFHEYIFRVITKTTNVNNSVKMVTEEYNFKTAEAPPGPVQSFTVVDKDLHSVVLSWQPPLVANGDIKYYIISYNGSEPTDLEVKDEKTLNVNALSHTITDLKAGFKYTFKIWAFTIEKGEEDTQNILMRTAAPAFKLNFDSESSKPESMKDNDKPLVTQNQITFQIHNPFSQENGYIRYFTIIATLEPAVGDPETDFPSWSDVVKNPNLKVYEAVNCTDLFSTDSTCGVVPGGRLRRAVHELDSRVFVLGAEPSNNCNKRQYCNGPLKPNTEYSIKVRGYTASGQFQETAYSEKVSTQSSTEFKSALIGGVTASILILIILIIIAVILVIKIRNKPQKAVRSPHSSWEQSAMSKLSRPVKLVDFPMHVMKMASDSDFKYAEEYEDLKDVGRDQPCTAAEFPPNRPKNRFTNILPYDHSRVKLLPADDEEGSDYINANYMPGYSSKREYIATQGPLPSTRDDFWRMIWEQNCRNIVMLTRCQEKGREKSDHYWPNDSEPKFYGDLQVHILNETHMPDWTISEFKVAMGDQSRNVRHFHYLVWPDFGVPSNCTSLIRFVRTVREKLIREGGPMVTHCSAGVGRSGTFIVLDHLLQLIREKDEVDIFSLVYKLRKERVLMVQTERFRPRSELEEYFSLQQYKFIHECLLCVLEEREEDITYVNIGQINAAFEDNDTDHGINMDTDDEGINVEIS